VHASAPLGSLSQQLLLAPHSLGGVSYGDWKVPAVRVFPVGAFSQATGEVFVQHLEADLVDRSQLP